MCSFTKDDLLYRFVWVKYCQKFWKLITFIRYFSNNSFIKQVLGLLLIFSEKSFLGGMETWTPVYLLRINNLTWLEQLKQKLLLFWQEVIFSAMTSSLILATHSCKSTPWSTHVFIKKWSVLKYLSNEVFISLFY